jgi:hypothetical protein
VRPVNQAIRLRGLRVTTYIPNHTAAIKKTKLVSNVNESSIEFYLLDKKKVFVSPSTPKSYQLFSAGRVEKCVVVQN